MPQSCKEDSPHSPDSDKALVDPLNTRGGDLNIPHARKLDLALHLTGADF